MKEKEMKNRIVKKLDFYILESFLKDEAIEENDKVKELSEAFKKNMPSTFKKRLAKNNFGLGADWTVALVEFLAKSDLIKSISNLGGIFAFAGIFHKIYLRVKKRMGRKLKIGPNSAILLAINKIMHVKGDNIEIELASLNEINKTKFGFIDKKKYLIVLRLVDVDGIEDKCCALSINWDGEIEEFFKV